MQKLREQTNIQTTPFGVGLIKVYTVHCYSLVLGVGDQVPGI